MKVRRFDFPDFKKDRYKIEHIFRHLPTWAGNAYLNFFLDSWERQGWLDRRLQRWPERKYKDNSRRGRRAILIGTGSGRLRRSLRLRTGSDFFEVYTKNPYAQIHNEGGRIRQKVSGRQRRYFWAMYYQAKRGGRGDEAARWKGMALSDTINIEIPQRKYMGDSATMRKRMVLHVERALANALK